MSWVAINIHRKDTGWMEAKKSMTDKGKFEAKPLTFERTAPEKPRGMAKAAQREWEFMVPILLARGVLTNVDGKALAAYCDVYAMWEEAREEIHKHGQLVEEPITDKDGVQIGTRYKANPAIKSYGMYLTLMKGYLVEFGLTPAARLKMKDLPAAEDPLESVLSGLPKDVRDRALKEAAEA